MRSYITGRKDAKRNIVMCSVIFLFLFSATGLVFADESSITTLRQMGKAFASIAEKASPAVVAIKTERTVTRQYGNYGGSLYDYIFPPNRQQRQQPRTYEETETAEGSGFIISDDGYIITNNHMVEGTTAINIELTDGRTFPATIVGTEEESDIAVLKIDVEDSPYIEMADSDTLEVGEWVLAIGNPLGFSHTVTAGIVSAKGRNNLSLNQLEDFIQTDAAINLGNSGGPLLNLDGKAVGMNTAIVSSGSAFSSSTGNIGIGFAIPINMVKFAYEQIRENGTVERGTLGVTIQTLTREEARAFGLEDTTGVAISDTVEDSPAEKAGLLHNDIILEVDGKAVESAPDLQNRVSMLRPGTTIELTIWRDNEKIKVPVTLGNRSVLNQETASVPAPTTPEQSIQMEMGLTVEEVNNEVAQLYGYPDQSGVVVSEVQPDSLAEQSGLVPGALIKEVNRQAVSSIKEFNDAIDAAKQSGSEQVILYVNYNGSNRILFLPLK